MKKKRLNTWLVIALILVLLTAVLTLIFGQGELNLGALKIPKSKVARVAFAECKGQAEQKDGFCIYTIDTPLDYYVTKEGSNFIIYGPQITQLYQDLNLDRTGGAVLPAETYSITDKSFSLSLVYNERDGINGKEPSFVLENPDQGTIDQFKQVRFVEVQVSDQIKIRLNTFALPTREIRAS